MFFNVIANRKGTEDWFICKIDGRVQSLELAELAKDKDFMSLYDKSELETQYFEYYIFKPIKKELGIK